MKDKCNLSYKQTLNEPGMNFLLGKNPPDVRKGMRVNL
jgi:hypothetical protein